MCERAHRGYTHQINRLILSLCLAATSVATIVAVILLGAPGLALLLPAGLAAALLVVDEEFSRVDGRVAQLDRASVCGTEGQRLESSRARCFPAQAGQHRRDAMSD